MTDPNDTRLANAIAEAATFINTPRGVEQRVGAVVSAAVDTVPGFDEASVSVAYRDGPVETRAASSDWVRKLDVAQYEAGEGPCFEAFTRGTAVALASLRDEVRWPVYLAQARQAGVTTQMAVPLADGGEVRGALNLYGIGREGINEEAPGIAAMFATHAALALGWARTEQQLGEALVTRKVIGQAIGLVMERYRIDEEKAFAFLLRVSSTGNVKLRDVAQQLVSQTGSTYSSKDSR